MAYTVGEVVICTIEVKNAAGTLTDPATSMKIQIQQLKPDNQEKVASTSMTNDSVGKYHYDLATSGYGKGDYSVTYTATDGSRITIQKDSFELE